MSWRVVAACAAGTGHLTQGQGCDDQVAYGLIASARHGPLLSLWVADGAGSAARGGDGAALAVRAAQDTVTARADEPLDEALVRACLAAVRQQIDDSAQELQAAPREFACTLLGVVASRERTVVLQVGDGGIVLDCGTGLQLATPPMQGEYANTTRFATDADAASACMVRHWDAPVQRAAVFTDGLQRLALDLATLTPHAPLFERLFAVVAGAPPDTDAALQAALLRFLDSAEVNARTDDDKALALAVRR
jgi:hypothetical protein